MEIAQAKKHPAVKALDEYEQWLTNEVTYNANIPDISNAFHFALLELKAYRKKFKTWCLEKQVSSQSAAKAAG